jgi:hypothetical protein
MYDCMTGMCRDPSTPFGCGGAAAGIIYFISFTWVAQYFLLNVFVAIVLDNFSALVSDVVDSLPQHTFVQFVETWMVFDPTGSEFIAVEDLASFLQKLPLPLGAGMSFTQHSILRAIKFMKLHVISGRVHYIELLHRLSERLVGVPYPPRAFISLFLLFFFFLMSFC